MAATQRIYVVTGTINDTEETRLIRAPNAAQALRFVAAATLRVEVPSQDRLIALTAAGVWVENAAAEPTAGA